MNKYDILLVITVLLASLFFIFQSFVKPKKSNYAFVYYENKEILKIDLSSQKKLYTVTGKNGNVVIEAGDGKVRVLEEKSPIHLCSKQGYIRNSHEKIICLPNKIVIELEESNFDTVI